MGQVDGGKSWGRHTESVSEAVYETGGMDSCTPKIGVVGRVADWVQRI